MVWIHFAFFSPSLDLPSLLPFHRCCILDAERAGREGHDLAAHSRAAVTLLVFVSVFSCLALELSTLCTVQRACTVLLEISQSTGDLLELKPRCVC